MDSKRKQLLVSTGQFLEKVSRLFGINLSSYLGKSYSFALLVLFSLLNYVTWHNVCTDYCAEHLIRKFMVTLQYILYVLLVLSMVVTSLFHPKQFAFPRQEMLIIDSILESYGAQFSAKDIFIAKYLQNVMAITASLLITMKCSYLVVVYNSIELIWYAIRSWYPMICLLIMDGLFCHYVNDIYLRFHELNKIAMQHSKETLSVSYIDFATIDTYNKRNNLVISKIRSIQHIHHALFVLAMKINANFSVQLLIASIISLNAIILYIHDTYYYTMVNSNKNDKDNFIVFKIAFVFFYAFRSLYISYICQRSRNESRLMTKILHNAFLKHKSLRSEVIHFSLQLIHEDLVFTACGLYEINIPLMCSIAGSIVTYVVMVIQLDATAKFTITNTTRSYIENNSTNMSSIV